MPDQLFFAMEVAVNGLMAGVLYALVALGFVLIYKASGIFNYAQGVIALFAAMTLVGIMEGQVPFAHMINSTFGTKIHHFGWTIPGFVAIALTVGLMVLLAWAVQRFIFRHLVNQEPIILFMATIGLAYLLEGMGALMWGDQIKTINLGLPSGASIWVEDTTESWFGYGFFLARLDILATVIAAALVMALMIFSQYSKHGRALRAVADDHQAALSVGISLNFIWILVWSIAGFVALVAGIVWGASSGVQFSLSLIALKALPVLMLGGFTSIPGAIVGGLIIGVGEKLFDFFMNPIIGGATENWFAYVLALIFLVFRPQGLFGEKIIERV
ncbi:branched-chain amino acid ABC transporter permease [Parasulfitobacter algicola]|uniref:Branched-chain amino acid ABC transporter permease n=1 Tax=Parasulfitobacter algicola TaxID=2614809 RepID=A0ABX2IR24_9RHOB|nr:branched-chain amino acid ABC transporter permease [Sulfitobacter algicola]NSX54975.1 branched-chain amino acid ABC transporter permease [Sulfitobacter algicola]